MELNNGKSAHPNCPSGSFADLTSFDKEFNDRRRARKPNLTIYKESEGESTFFGVSLLFELLPV
jgi:hypothetical protein